MGSACSSESGSYETSPSESSAESSETSSEDDSSNQVSSSVFFTEKSKLSGKEKLRRRTRSIVSGIKIRSPKEEPLEIVQTTNKDGVSLIRKLRLIRRLGPLSRVVNSGANNIVVPEIRVIEAPNSEKSSADNKRASFFQRAKVARLNSLSKSATDSERNSTPHVSGKSYFSRKARMLASLGSSPKMTKSEDHETRSSRPSTSSKVSSVIRRNRMLGKLFQAKSEEHPPAEEVDIATDQALKTLSTPSSRDSDSMSELSPKQSRWGSTKSSRFSLSIFSRHKDSTRSSGKRRPSGSSKMSEETSQVPEIVETPAETVEKVEPEETQATTELSESTVREIQEETVPESEQNVQEKVEDSVPEAQQKEDLVESENIGSVNSRLSRYQSKAQQSPEVKREAVPTSVSSIDHFKDNYLKQTEKTSSTVQSEMATAGALSLKDRMKMFENQSSKSVQREVVGQAERAGDIRSKISNWGVSESSNGYSQRERITVAPLSERRSQYAAVANAN